MKNLEATGGPALITSLSMVKDGPLEEDKAIPFTVTVYSCPKHFVVKYIHGTGTPDALAEIIKRQEEALLSVDLSDIPGLTLAK